MSDLNLVSLKDVLRQVERDEAEAIELLCAVLENVEKSNDFRPLPHIRSLLKQWQHTPPGGIVTSLRELQETLEECQDHDNP